MCKIRVSFVNNEIACIRKSREWDERLFHHRKKPASFSALFQICIFCGFCFIYVRGLKIIGVRWVSNRDIFLWLMEINKSESTLGTGWMTDSFLLQVRVSWKFENKPEAQNNFLKLCSPLRVIKSCVVVRWDSDTCRIANQCSDITNQTK